MRAEQQTEHTASVQRAGWDLADWCTAVGIARPTFYTIPEAQRPSSVKIGTRRIITEAPADYLRRVTVAGGVVIPPRKAA